jgi:hypothetical protein
MDGSVIYGFALHCPRRSTSAIWFLYFVFLFFILLLEAVCILAPLNCISVCYLMSLIKRPLSKKLLLQGKLWFFLEHSTTQMLTNTHVHSPLWTHARTPYPYEHLWRTEPADLEVDKVTTGASLLTGTPPTTETIAPGNPGINPGKCKCSCQV